MESKNTQVLKINIDNYSGPLDVLLDLAKTQKVDLANISVTQLADQFIEFINDTKNINLDIASEYLLMATWLTYLKSKLLLPEDEEGDFEATKVAEKLKLQLKKLELIRLLSDQMLKRKRLGRDIFMRGMKGRVKSTYNTTYNLKLYDVLKTYSSIIMKKDFKTINIPKLPVLTTEDGIKIIKSFIMNLSVWKNIDQLIPEKFNKFKNLKRSGKAGLFAGSLELVKEGNLLIKQDKLFDEIFIKQK